MLLEVKEIVKSFGGIKALDGVSMEIEDGTVNGLIGPNGSGKTTLINIITGFCPPDSGKIIFKGEDITGLPPPEIFDRKICRTFQISDIRSKMTTLENMLLARKQVGEQFYEVFLKWSRVKEEERKNIAEILPLLEKVEIREFADEPAGVLSGGQRKLLSFGRALAAGPELFLLDEPMAGINPTLANRLIGIIKDLAKSGKTFVIVEHDMEVIQKACDRVYVLSAGKKIAEGTPEEIQKNDEVLKAYLSGAG